MALVVAPLLAPGCAPARHRTNEAAAARRETPAVLAPFLATPMPVVERMIEIAGVRPSDVVYDLGSGDGRMVVEAAKCGARAVGIELDATLCQLARARAEREGVGARVEIRHGDILEEDFSDATVVLLYLLPDANERLRPRLEALPAGTRVVAHDYSIGDWQPLYEETVPLLDAHHHVIRLWRVGE